MSDAERHDLIIIGAGPAGLTAAMMAESQKLDTLVLEAADRLGGQAGTATFIENCPGMPDGVTGEQFASLMIDHALKFNTEFIAPSRVTEITSNEGSLRVTTSDQERFIGSAVVLAIGGEHRRLQARNLAAYLGRGAVYQAPSQVSDYRGKNICIIGGSDSAGQAAVRLAEAEAESVDLIVRGSTVVGKMSGSLTDKITRLKNIRVRTSTNLVGVDGKGCLQSATIKTGDNIEELPTDSLFILIGSQPRTEWLPEAVARDRQGYVLSGIDIPEEAREQFKESTNGREPFPHETSMPGLFVSGDVRHGNQGWVSIAMLDGAAVVPELHRLRIHNHLKH